MEVRADDDDDDDDSDDVLAVVELAAVDEGVGIDDTVAVVVGGSRCWIRLLHLGW